MVYLFTDTDLVLWNEEQMNTKELFDQVSYMQVADSHSSKYIAIYINHIWKVINFNAAFLKNIMFDKSVAYISTIHSNTTVP